MRGLLLSKRNELKGWTVGQIVSVDDAGTFTIIGFPSRRTALVKPVGGDSNAEQVDLIRLGKRDAHQVKI